MKMDISATSSEKELEPNPESILFNYNPSEKFSAAKNLDVQTTTNTPNIE